MVHVVNMNYAKHGLYLSDGKAKKPTTSFYVKKKFTFIRFAATRFKIKQCYKTNQNSSKTSIIFQDRCQGKFKQSLTRKNNTR